MALDKSVGTQSLAMDSKKEEYKGKKLRVAIVGCGGIAQTHMEAYKGIPEVEKTLVVADGAEEFADAVVSLYRDPERLKTLSRETQKYIRTHFSVDGAWEIIKEDFSK